MLLDSDENSGGQNSTDPQPARAAATFSDDAGQTLHDAHEPFARIIAQIRETHRQRQDLHRAEKSLTLQIKAVERRLAKSSGSGHVYRASQHPCAGSADPNCDEGQVFSGPHQTNANVATPQGNEGHYYVDDQSKHADIAFFATLPLREAREVIKPQRTKLERQMVKLAKQLPAYAFVDSVHGFGAIGFAQIVGEAGDLSNYANPAKLWKRMGLAVINGKSQRRVAGAEALEHGYSAVRRSIMYCIGDSMIKKQNPYRELYLSRKIAEAEKLPDGTKMHHHRRAQRYMEKRLLRDLWKFWRDSAIHPL